MMLLTFCIIFVVLVTSSFHRCVYELFMAHTLEVQVKLCPHISDSDIEYALLDYDVCIANIKEKVDSFAAHCSNKSDKDAIHRAIQQSPYRFEIIDKIVETFRSDYALTYKVHKIIGLDHKLYFFILRYITILLYPFIVGMVVYPFGFHLCLVVLPLIGLILDFLVKFTDNEELRGKWKTFTEGWTFGRYYVYGILYHPIALIFSNLCREQRKKAVKYLADAIVVIVKRVNSFDDDVLPSYEDHCKSWSRLYDWAPVTVFCMWRRDIKRLVEESKKSAENTTAVNESTHLLTSTTVV